MIAQLLMDTPRVREYLDSVADGFYKNPGEIIASIGGVAALLFVLLFLALWWRKKEEQRRKEREDTAFDAISERLKLTLSEIELLKRLAQFSPGGKFSLPGLVKNQQNFNIAVKRALRRKIAGDSEIAVLRFRLGHNKSNTRGILSSTASLVPGTAVEVISRDGSRVYASILEVTPVKFSVKILSDAAIDGKVELRFARPTGVYSCSQQVVRYNNRIADFRHTEAIARIQKRGSLRKRLSMSVSISMGDRDYSGKIIDLSEGGARIHCPGAELREKQWIELTLFRKTPDPVSVSARVVRVEGENDLIGIEFHSINSRIRERIRNMVFH